MMIVYVRFSTGAAGPLSKLAVVRGMVAGMESSGEGETSESVAVRGKGAGMESSISRTVSVNWGRTVRVWKLREKPCSG
jgi:hypothetical protein